MNIEIKTLPKDPHTGKYTTVAIVNGKISCSCTHLDKKRTIAEVQKDLKDYE